MMLDTRAIAVQGVGYGNLAMAVQGFWDAIPVDQLVGSPKYAVLGRQAEFLAAVPRDVEAAVDVDTSAAVARDVRSEASRSAEEAPARDVKAGVQRDTRASTQRNWRAGKNEWLH